MYPITATKILMIIEKLISSYIKSEMELQVSRMTAAMIVSVRVGGVNLKSISTNW